MQETKSPLILVELDADQIRRARRVNGERKRITHALLCGPHGQIFGTEKQCRKYFWAWDPEKGKVFRYLFSRAREARRYEITDYLTTFNLVNKLIAAEDAERARRDPIFRELARTSARRWEELSNP